MFAVKAIIYGVLYKQSSSIVFEETNPALSFLKKHLVIGQRQKAPNFLAFHWSPHGSLVSIGQHFVTTNINTEIEIEADLNTKSDQVCGLCIAAIAGFTLNSCKNIATFMLKNI